MEPRYLEELAKSLSRADIPDFTAGASGYFSKPEKGLDPAIFDGDHVRGEVEEYLLATLFRFWRRCGYMNPERWTTVWLAGSGASYQWSANRGNGDLDVLMGINWDDFYASNPQWAHASPTAMTEHIDDELRQELWPRTADTLFGGKAYEVTYFVILDASDIRSINPYAAYNLTAGSWTIEPSRETAYEHQFNEQWAPYATQDVAEAAAIRQAVVNALQKLGEVRGPWRVNILNRLSTAVTYAAGLMEDIHGNRRRAFMSPLGHGYWDYHNWRWQMAKKNGIVAVLGAIVRASNDALVKVQKTQYGAELGTADDLTVRAVMAYRDHS